MTSSRAALVAAALVSASLLVAAALGDGQVALTAALVGNLMVPALWVAAVLLNRRLGEVLAVLGGMALVVMAVAGVREGLMAACVGLAGVAGAVVLSRRWRVLPILGVAAVFLAPVLVLEMDGEGIVEATEALYAENRRALAEGPAAELTESERQAALAEYDAVVERMLATQRRFWPAMVLIGLMSQAALALGMGWLLTRLVVANPPRPARRRWEEWRAPFISVWTLIGGLAAVITGIQPLAMIGWNLVLLAGLLLVVQGLAVQSWLMRRLLPPVPRVLFWIMAAMFLAPVLLGGGLLIGLADQWMNLRRDRSPAASNDDDEP